MNNRNRVPRHILYGLIITGSGSLILFIVLLYLLIWG